MIIIGGQAYPLEMFPVYQVTSGFSDGVVNAYSASYLEVLLGLGGVALALAITGVGMKVLRILPTNLSDANIGQD